ncbi:unnamed protein product [Somion occarium]|uniref:DNA damage-binding protein CMR1 n=1 Tax=Somion occarium TaxID=3059160 RepID=A0ABP1DAS9_9APHY
MSEFDLEREANIARNRELLAQLGIESPVAVVKIPEKVKAKPIQPKKRKAKASPPPPRETRSSARLKKPVIDPNETPEQKRKREKEEEERRRKEEEERLAEEERAREAKRPRHQDLDISVLGQELDEAEQRTLRSTFQATLQAAYPRGVASQDAFVYDDKEKEEHRAVIELKKKLASMKIVSRAKVTQNRIYCAAYHPEVTKDLIFFGDKNGQLGIWDALAPVEEVADEDDDVSADDREGGRYWRLQLHWPASSQSSISSIKFDPTDAHSVYTSSYDCTVRSLSFTSGISREIYSAEDALISSIDLTTTGHEMWISDAAGGTIHLDLREAKSRARRYQLSDQKIGSVSINPVVNHLILTASNSRVLRVWDTRKLAVIESKHRSNVDDHAINRFLKSKDGKNCLRGEWSHGKSVSSAYWDPRGRGIVSTSYDDKIRLWDIKPIALSKDAVFPSFRPLTEIRHNCQSGKWVSVLKAQWSPNPDVYPHFTIGNMDHSLNIYTGKGVPLAKLADKALVTAVQAVTCSHPSIVERVASGNASGRGTLWGPSND